MSYLSTVLADNPSHYWRLADGGSYLLHDIGSSKKDVLADAPTNGGFSGIEQGGGSFMISEAAAIHQRDTVTLPSPISLEAWYWRAQRNGQAGEIITCVSGGTNRWQIEEEGDGTLFTRMSGATVNPATIVSLQHWHHVVATYDEAIVRLYLDGVQIGTVANAGHVSYDTSLWLGVTGGAVAFLQGALSEVAIYPTALSAARVAAHYAAVVTPPDPVGGLASTFSNIVISYAGGGVTPLGLSSVINGLIRVWSNTP